MFTHNIDPIFFSIGPVEVRYYGLIYAIGFMLLYWFLLKIRTEIDLTREEVEQYVVYLMIGLLVGSRLGEVLLWDPGYYLSNPLEILKIWKGGMAFHGGLIGTLFAGWLWCKKNKKKPLKIFDYSALPIAFGLALGRLGNWMNGELWGTVWNGPWCVEFKGAEGCRHPYQIYAFLKRMAVFGILVALHRTKKFKDGFIFWSLIFLFGVGRAFIDTLREDVIYYGLKLGQWYSIGMVLVAGYVLIKYYREDIKKMFR